MAGEQRDPLDHLLDDALATYASQDPRPGLEDRVLQRIHAEGARPRLAFLRWALPIAALGCLLAGIAVRNHLARPPAPLPAVRTAAGPPAAIAMAQRPKPLRRERRIPRPATAPKQAEFPVRAPLTQQELALAAFARTAPDEALRAFGEAQPMRIEPLRIEEIELQPSEISDGAK